MKNILLIGSADAALQSLSEELESTYHVAICSPIYSDICSLIKSQNTDLILFFQSTFASPDYSIYKGLGNDFRSVPVLTICSTEDFASYRNYCPEPQFHFLFRPIRTSRLLEKCAVILKEISSDDTETLNIHSDSLTIVQPANYLTESPANESAQQSVPSRRRLKVLAVDDSPLTLRSFKKMLEKRYEIRLSFSGDKALEMIPVFRPDIIFLDYEMPGLNGMTVFMILKKNPKTADIPVIFLTGVAEKERILQVLKHHPAGYLLKPLDETKLIEAIENTKTGNS